MPMHGEDTREGLAEADVAPDPVVQFGRWYDDARSAGLVEPSAMTLATATAGGVPSARMVLLRGVDRRGFVFYTNYESRKAAELAANPLAALVFWWGELQRQVAGGVPRGGAVDAHPYRPRPVRFHEFGVRHRSAELQTHARNAAIRDIAHDELHPTGLDTVADDGTLAEYAL